MQQVVVYIIKIMKLLKFKVLYPFDWLFSYFIFYSNNIKFSSFRCHGIPKINVGLGGQCLIGPHFKMNNRESSNPIGRFHRCSIIVGKKGNLIIGKNVGMSSIAIVCHHRIEIGDNVNLGGNVVIYDTDFHSLNSADRLSRKLDFENTKTSPVKIGTNAFIGAHTTILKGITIGENSIVGACSVVTKDIPANEIWAGNPAKCVRKVEE